MKNRTSLTQDTQRHQSRKCPPLLIRSSQAWYILPTLTISFTADFGVAAQLVSNKSRRNTFVGTPVYLLRFAADISSGWRLKSSVNQGMITKPISGP